VHYWHPDGTPPGQPDDLPRARWGFPTIPGLLDAARQPVASAGLRRPWYSAYGNHDALTQGNLPQLPEVTEWATGHEKLVGVPNPVDIERLAEDFLRGNTLGVRNLAGGIVRQVTPDPDRRTVDRTQTMREHFRTSGRPIGHGFTSDNLTTGNAFYAFDAGPVRCLVLDSVNTHGGANGSLDPAQFEWLQQELQSGHRRYLDTAAAVVNAHATDRLFVLFSHHTAASMDNWLAPPLSHRVLGRTVRDLLLRYPNVVLWVNGHTHINLITAHVRPPEAAIPGGFFEVTTASLIDWPQQARTIELVDNNDGTLSIITTIIDTAATATHPATPSDPLSLAALSRELAGNDWQARARPTRGLDGRRGALTDRNVELLLPSPFPRP
jgi:metallophosphoesterase (TIGR03767 family)